MRWPAVCSRRTSDSLKACSCSMSIKLINPRAWSPTTNGTKTWTDFSISCARQSWTAILLDSLARIFSLITRVSRVPV